MKFEALIDSIKQSIASGVSTPIRIEDRSFLFDIVSKRSKARPKYVSLKGLKGFALMNAILHNVKSFLSYLFHSPYINFIILVSTIVLSLLLLIVMISFFLGQVILPSPNHHINDRGTLVFNQPLATDHYMFLLNSADLWADSGIGVIKGDMVDITVSGSFYSKICNLYDAALNNDTTKYNYYHKGNDRSGSSIRPELPFGALLYRIQRPGSRYSRFDPIHQHTEYRDNDSHKISFIAAESGILHFAVNDIVITEDGIPVYVADSLINKCDSAAYKSGLERYGDRMGKKWFDDNCGELLINVKVTRNVAKKSDIPFHDKVFISLMRLFPAD